MAEGTRGHEKYILEGTVKQLKESSDKQAATLSELSKMVAATNLKFEHMTSRIEESCNGNNASINRSGTNYHSYCTSSFQTKFSKLNFPNFEGENYSGWIYKCDRFLKN